MWNIYRDLTYHKYLLLKKTCEPLVLMIRDHYNSIPNKVRFENMKTVSISSKSALREWVIIDATGAVLGRLASEIALRLRGKHKPEYTPNADCGDYVVVVNSSKITVTGNKAVGKKYYSHTGFPGGIKEINFSQMMEKFPERALEKAVRGMLPRGPLGREMYRKLKVYGGSEHPHSAQQPTVLTF